MVFPADLRLMTLGLSSILFAGLADSVKAQTVRPDGSTGTLVEAAANNSFVVTGGTLSGNNLFHSFENFSPEGFGTLFDLDDATYAGTADGVSTIFSRVTGSTPSSLNGSLEVTGGNSPSFFLLNPNGILLGPSFAINVPGSLFLSTAERLSFQDDTVFSATDSTARPLLTVSAPVGIQFGEAAAPITLNGNFGDSALTLFDFFSPNEVNRLTKSTTLTLLGGGLELNDTYFSLPIERIQLGSVGPMAQVSIDASTHALTYPTDTPLQDIRMENMVFDVSGSGNSEISAVGRQLQMINAGVLAETTSAEGTPAISLQFSDDIHLKESVLVMSFLPPGSFSPPVENLAATALAQASESTALERGSDGIALRTGGQLTVEGSVIATNTYRERTAADLTLQAQEISLLGARTLFDNATVVSSATFGAGDSGNVSVTADTLTASGALFLQALAYGSAPGEPAGDGQTLSLRVGQLTLEEGAQVGTGTFGSGDSGELRVEATRGVDINGALTLEDGSSYQSGLFASAEAGSIGNGGDLFLTTPSLRLTGGGNVIAATFGTGNAGNMSIQATTDVEISGAYSFEDGSSSPSGLFNVAVGDLAGVSGNGGNLRLTTPKLRLNEGGAVSVTTFGSGDAGTMTIQAATEVDVNGVYLSGDGSIYPSGLFASTEPGATGSGGELFLTTARLGVRGGGNVSATTFGTGDAGKLSIRATSEVDVSGVYTFEDGDIYSSGLLTSAELASTGNGGDLFLNTPLLRVSEGGTVSAKTFGTGNAGNLTIRAADILVSESRMDDLGDKTGLVATVDDASAGNGGQINIVSDRLYLSSGGQVSASTRGDGNAGSVNIQSEVIELEGTSTDGRLNSRISSRSTSTFDAGTVTVTGDVINIQNNATISVNSLAAGDSGDINLSARQVFLNQGSIQAESTTGDQGNITITSKDVLLLREGSNITTNATETATGGNIILNAPVIAGLENSDISANAIRGDGGNIRLITQGLIGLEPREQLTSESDITVTSELGVDGMISFESPNVEPESGLVQLPANLADAINQIMVSCAANAGNQFIRSGRGGLPESPFQMQSSDYLEPNNLPLDSGEWPTDAHAEARHAENEDAANVVDENARNSHQYEPLQEANGWTLNRTGEVELLAMSDVSTSLIATASSNDCLQQMMALSQ